MKFNANMVGLWTGIVIGGCHVLWSILVAFGWAQSLIDWIFGLHFILPIFTVTEFKLATAAILTGLTFIVGYAIGYLATLLWNKLSK